jgi:hypothetical protein
MKTFLQFLNEQREAPQGVIFSNDEAKAFVGKERWWWTSD